MNLASNMFAFIREFARLSQKPVESLDAYIKTFWLDEVPQEPGCMCAAWLRPEDYEAEKVVETWLSIERPEREDPPDVPLDVQGWVDERQWEDSSPEYPELHGRILNPEWDEKVPDDGVPQFLTLEEFPVVREAWDEYVEDEWWPWAEEDRKRVKVQECYNEFFSMHRTQLSMGEQYEFLLAVGCLHWSTPSGGQIKRHLLTLPVNIRFDSENAVVSVATAGGMGEVQLEVDMLKVDEQPALDIANDSEARRKLLGDNLLHPNAKLLLTAWVQGLHSEGVFYDEMARVSGMPPVKPVVRFAPALIVRRRTQRNLITACETIIEQLRGKDAEVPAGVRKIIGELGVDDHRELETEGGSDNGQQQDNEIYFPLLYNDEQKRIVYALNRQTGVLVQGPPGTGKSQTIANLICHLLATGKRILVTSQKAPALRVLKEKLPAVVADLCVMVLGEGTDEQNELNRSVGEITARHTSRLPRQQARQKIENLREALKKARKDEARAFENLCTLREKETFQHAQRFGNYEGALSQIADRVRREEEQFNWFDDRLSRSVSLLKGQAPELSFDSAKAHRLLSLLHEIDEGTAARCSRHLLPLDQLLSAGQFTEMVKQEVQAREELNRQEGLLNHPGREALSKTDDQTLNSLLADLNEYLGSLRELRNGNEAWGWEAAQQVLRGDAALWRALYERCGGLLQAIRVRPTGLADIEVEELGERSHRAVLLDAKELYKHVSQGKQLGFWIFRSPVVKQGLYLVQKTKVDGRLCSSTESLEKLIGWLELSEMARKLSEQWTAVADSTSDFLPLNQKVHQYEHRQARLQSVFDLAERATVLGQRLGELSPELLCIWHDHQEVNSLRDLVTALLAERRLTEASQAISGLEDGIRSTCLQPDTAPENSVLHNAIRERLVDEYTRAYAELTALWNWRRQLEERNGLYKELSGKLPRLAQSLSMTYADAAWDERLSQLSAAWSWVCADHWLSEMADPGAESRLEDQIRQCQKDSANTLAKLAAELAWGHCMRRISDRPEAYRAMDAWRHAVTNIGGGTGRRAPVWRERAREQLALCRPAIPAWVMPLYKVLDTVRMEPEIFDVVIIDEASQSGPEAIFLSYLAKQLIIVGDDQQIQPEFVGIERNAVDQLLQRFLSDVPQRFLFGTESSLFSIARNRFGDPIRLREHFRCMPEIIAFSNQLCYQDQPLIPLRQFGRNRLSPVLRTHYVEGGYQTGTSGPNPVEAERLVEAIVQCCHDPAYVGKTFGVISLLSTARQDREIEQLLLKRLESEEIEERNILCGDAYDFQGDERDVVFLSMVSARSEHGHIGTLSDAKAMRRFNVAVSRAKDQVHLFHSVQEGELSQTCLRLRLLSYMKNSAVDRAVLPPNIESVAELRQMAHRARRAVEKPPKPFDSWFEVDVYLVIAEQGHIVVPQYEVSGYFIDMVVVGGTRKLAVECDGDEWHGPVQYEEDMRRQRQLERCGWEFFRVRGSSYYRNPSAALAPLWEMVYEPEVEDRKNWGEGTEVADILGKQLQPDQSSPQDQPAIGPDLSEPGKEADEAPTKDRKKSQPPPEKRSTESGNSGGIRGTPNGWSVEDLLRLESRDLGRVICEILEDRPNYTAKKDDITTFVCKRFEVITRGTPRRKLKQKVSWAIARLEREGFVEEYKARNIRVRLLHPTGQNKLL